MTASERIRAARLEKDKHLVSALDQNPVETRKTVEIRCVYCGAPETPLNKDGKCNTGFPHCFLIDLSEYSIKAQS